MNTTIDSDVLIVGGGPAGVSAACRTAESGVRALLVDANPALGGQIWRGAGSTRDSAAEYWLARFVQSGAQHLGSREVVGFDAPGVLRIADFNGRSETLSYRTLILATGARELFLPLPGWTLPGFFGAGG